MCAVPGGRHGDGRPHQVPLRAGPRHVAAAAARHDRRARAHAAPGQGGDHVRY